MKSTNTSLHICRTNNYLYIQTLKKTPKNCHISPFWCLSPFHAAQGSEEPPSMILLRGAFAASCIPTPLPCRIAAVAFHRAAPSQCFPPFPSLPWILLMIILAKFSVSLILGPIKNTHRRKGCNWLTSRIVRMILVLEQNEDILIISQK